MIRCLIITCLFLTTPLLNLNAEISESLKTFSLQSIQTFENMPASLVKTEDDYQKYIRGCVQLVPTVEIEDPLENIYFQKLIDLAPTLSTKMLYWFGQCLAFSYAGQIYGAFPQTYFRQLSYLAIDSLEKSLLKDPTQIDRTTANVVADIFYSFKQYTNFECWHHIQERPTASNTLRYIGIRHFQYGRFGQSLTYQEKLTTQNFEDQFNLALTYAYLTQWDKALPLCYDMVKQGPYALFHVAYIYSFVPEKRKAAKFLLKHLKWKKDQILTPLFADFTFLGLYDIHDNDLFFPDEILDRFDKVSIRKTLYELPETNPVEKDGTVQRMLTLFRDDMIDTELSSSPTIPPKQGDIACAKTQAINALLPEAIDFIFKYGSFLDIFLMIDGLLKKPEGYGKLPVRHLLNKVWEQLPSQPPATQIQIAGATLDLIRNHKIPHAIRFVLKYGTLDQKINLYIATPNSYKDIVLSVLNHQAYTALNTPKIKTWANTFDMVEDLLEYDLSIPKRLQLLILKNMLKRGLLTFNIQAKTIISEEIMRIHFLKDLNIHDAFSFDEDFKDNLIFSLQYGFHYYLQQTGYTSFSDLPSQDEYRKLMLFRGVHESLKERLGNAYTPPQSPELTRAQNIYNNVMNFDFRTGTTSHYDSPEFVIKKNLIKIMGTFIDIYTKVSPESESSDSDDDV